MSRFHEDALSLYDRDWALVAAGTVDDHNAMTISWGGMGTLWNRPVVTVYVKPIRHTARYLMENDLFTVSFYDEKYRGDLRIMGTRSGRNGNKEAHTFLTPVALDGAVTYEQAEVTLLCKKIYWQDLDPANMPPEEVTRYYTEEAPHRMYIGEVINVIRKA